MPAWTSALSLVSLPTALLGAQERHAAARHDAFLDRGAGGVERVLDAVLLLLDLDLGGAADADHRDAAGELGQPLLQLLAVVVGGGLLDLRLDLVDARLDVLLLAGAVDDRGLLLLDHAPSWRGRASPSVTFSSLMPRSSEMSWPPVRMAMSSSIALRRSPKPGALTAATFRPPRSLLTTSVASASPSTSSAMMSSGLPDLHHRLEHRQHRLQARELLLVQQDVGVLELGDHLLGVGDEVGREVAAVELHALDDLEFGLERLGFLDRDHALVADLLHRLGDHLADRRVAVRRRWCRPAPLPPRSRPSSRAS